MRDLSRAHGLNVFVELQELPLDTNHLERQIRSVSLGRRNRLFSWTKVAAEYARIFQSLLATCRLKGVYPNTYLVEVSQRIEAHPMREVALLTSSLTREQFAANPLRSAIDRSVKNPSA